MRNYVILLFLVLFQFSFSQDYPVVQSVPVTTEIHKTKIVDNYSWMENNNNPDLQSWVGAQNFLTNTFLEGIKKNYPLERKIKEYDALSTNSLPNKKGKYFYSVYRRDKDKPGVLYYRKELRDVPVEIFNPFKIYKSETSFITNYYPSANAKYIAIEMSLNGSDKREIRFTDMSSLNPTADVIKDIKFSRAVWKKDKGIYYKKNSNKNTTAKDSTYQIYYHELGKAQDEDKLIYDSKDANGFVSFFQQENQMIIVEKNENLTSYKAINLLSDDHVITDLLINDSTDFQFHFYKNDTLFYSSKDYDWGEVRYRNLTTNSEPKVLIPQIYNHLLVGTLFLEHYIVCAYRTLGKNYISVYDYDGKFIRKFDAPYGCDFSIKFYNPETEDLFVSFYSYVVSFQNFKLNIRTGDINPYYNEYIIPKPTIFPLDYFETKIITYKSRDNKDVPITIVHKKGMVMDGNNPTLLSAYGGYGKVDGPYFNSGLLWFLEKGGVYAYAEIRGGGEKGLKWHTEGKGLKKNNTFNDFIDAAEFLIRQKYTSPNKLAITGGSNGGLVVGVAMTQRPELFKLAIPVVGVFDMIKFKDYTAGKYWTDEYGNIDNEEDFKNILTYSPYHNIKDNVNYPATYIITGENDDRVLPFHSYKLAAKLQNREVQKNPIYLKVQSESGHNGKVSNYQAYVDQKTDFYSVLMHFLME
ncbi:MAG: S9 family peptidase [Flavobacterium sp.]|nr:S9 family peptidase [Flavobacterium sp.]